MPAPFRTFFEHPKSLLSSLCTLESVNIMSLSSKLSITDVDLKGKRVLIRVSLPFISLDRALGPFTNILDGRRSNSEVLPKGMKDPNRSSCCLTMAIRRQLKSVEGQDPEPFTELPKLSSHQAGRIAVDYKPMRYNLTTVPNRSTSTSHSTPTRRSPTTSASRVPSPPSSMPSTTAPRQSS